jgi:hypothetical protein
VNKITALKQAIDWGKQIRRKGCVEANAYIRHGFDNAVNLSAYKHRIKTDEAIAELERMLEQCKTEKN